MTRSSIAGRIRGHAGAWLALAVLVAACAPPPLPPAEAPSPVALETLRRTEMMFLYPERLDRRLLVGALDALEARFDSVRFDDGGDGASEGRLYVGDRVAVVPLNGRFDSRRYLQVLGQALRFVDAHLSPEEIEDARFDGEDEQPTLEMLALRGALRALDPYSTIFSGRNTEDFRIRFSGKLSGIGTRIGRLDGHLTAMKVFSKSPAEKGGLQDGDWILTIDGDPTQPLSLSEAVDRIRGKAGSRIVLGVLRRDKEDDTEERLDVEIVRGEVNVPNVETRHLDDDETIGYAEIASVSRTTATEFRKKVIDLGDIRGLVLDLRSNSGGSMLAAQQLADLFLSQQLIVRVVGRNGRPAGPQNRAVADRRVVFDMPVVILVSGATASAAEILSGALAPLDSVTIVGQKTFGKGVIQQVLPLPDENLLKLTVAEYLLSEDRAVHGRGIVPDIELAPVPDKRLGRLGSVEPGAIPYVREAGETDDFPLEVGRLLLSLPRDEALGEIRRLSTEGIAEALAQHGITWEPSAELPAELPRELDVRLEHGPLLAGEKSSVDVVVTNPNPFAVPAAWVVLEAAADYLSNRIAALGDIPAGGSAHASLEIEPPAGVSADQHPLTVHVASGDRTLQAAERVLQVAAQAPLVTIDVARQPGEEGDMLEVLVRNAGSHPTGSILVAVPGANRSIEQLEPGAEEQVELALSADPDNVLVTLSGPWVRRRVEIPIPEQSIHVSLPEMRIARARRFGGQELRVEVSDPMGLREGWIRLGRVEDDEEEEERDEDRPRSPDQKVAYADWAGRPTGQIVATLEDGEQNLTVKIETASGISVWDMRHLAAQ